MLLDSGLIHIFGLRIRSPDSEEVVVLCTLVWARDSPVRDLVLQLGRVVADGKEMTGRDEVMRSSAMASHAVEEVRRNERHRSSKARR